MKLLDNKTNELSIFLDNAVKGWELGNKDKLVILGGHFLLNWNNGIYADHLPKTEDDIQLENDEFMLYTLATWGASCHLAKTMSAKMIVLVNDWQRIGVPEDKKLRGAWERKKLDLLNLYYFNNPKLPTILGRLLEKYDLDDNTIEKASDSMWMFSESEFRNQLIANVNANEVTYPACKISIENDTKRVVIKNEDLYEFTGDSEFVLSHGNSTNCAGEIVELLHTLGDRGYSHFICLHPKSCQNFVNSGTVIFKQLYPALSKLKIMNISIPQNVSINDIAVNIV